MASIWRFENEFVEQCSSVLDEILRLLGCDDLPHSLFLVGIHLETNDSIIIPDNAMITPSELMKNLDPIKDCFIPYPDNNDISDIEWHRLYQAYDRACWECWSKLKEAISSLIDNSGNLFAISPCREMNGYIVALVATYNKSSYEQYPSLDMRVFTEHGRTPSLLFGAIEAVLDKFADDFRKRDAGGKYENDPPTASKILCTAGAFFTRVHAWAGKSFSSLDIQYRGTLELFDACNIISALPYESRTGLGDMIIAKIQHPAIKTTICLQQAIMANQHKRVRKMLEMCKGDLHLLTDSRYVWGIGTFNQDLYERIKYDVFKIKFVGHFHWELWHLDDHLMSVKNGEPRLPLPRIDPVELQNRLKEKFPKISSQELNPLFQIIEISTSQQHGTVLIISEDAETESTRLAQQSKIQSFTPDKLSLLGITSIDGALMISPDGICHGVGLILDGSAGEHEDPSRGARYNSVVRYTRDRKNCIGIVVSVDGMIDILPKSKS